VIDREIKQLQRFCRVSLSGVTSTTPTQSEVRTGKQTIHSATTSCETLVMGRQVWDKLIDHPAFIERHEYHSSVS